MAQKQQPKKQENITTKSPIALREEEILNFWKENNIFKKTLEKPSPQGEYIFYDGPPFATGLPHYGHILASAIKDAVPRYKTMRGFHVDRRWGWDTHGLPIENIVEKDLKVSGRKEIEALGIEKFNEYARSKVLSYVHEWKRTVERIARWVDFDGAYMTMDNSFIESVWWALKEMYSMDLIYESTRVLPYCPRCETPIANSEIAMDNSYKDITDISVYVKFELVDEPGTYVVAWTTTPWTLPGNTALAVNEDITYVKIKTPTEKLIVAKEKLGLKVFEQLEYTIDQEFKGKELVGKSYKPIFDYFINKPMPDKENGWKIYAAPYVTLESGTAIVHLAPNYGEEDMALAKKYAIPTIHHIGLDGRFVKEVTDFAGLKAKPKEDPQATDIEIIKNLAHRGILFAKEKIVHSYPHCYRCETPLLYYALPAWFVKIQTVKPRLVELNKNIHWVPEHLKEGRFKNSLEAAPDWNISRNRFWASPLPIWTCDACGKREFLGSIDDIKKRTKSSNNYFIVRHGQAENNIKNILSSVHDASYQLTEEGKHQAKKAAQELKDKEIDLIISSDFVRTKETAEIIATELGIPKEHIVFDERLREVNFGTLNDKSLDDYHNQYPDLETRFTEKLGGGESLNDVRERLGSFLYERDAQYQNKNILIVSHEAPIWILKGVALGATTKQTVALRSSNNEYIKNCEIQKLDFAYLPHNARYELDLHRPYIDSITFRCSCGEMMKRIPEVIDCWFESGSMPFAQVHYPFEKKEWFHDNFPSDFVAEYIAQTRTWFYYMLVVSGTLFDSIPFKNVVTTGTVLAEDGQKMSKSKGNFPDPWLLFDKYGVDAIRYYLLSSSIMRSEDLNFSEKDVESVMKKLLMRLTNVVSFFELYRDPKSSPGTKIHSDNILDQWILARLSEVGNEVTENMDKYEIDSALRPFDLFIDDLSTWYLRRSRDRFKGDDEKDKQAALATTQYVLFELSKLMAPFMPFIAEEIYQKVSGESKKESVHLESWSDFALSNMTLLENMKKVRDIVSLALEARAKANIKVRQPLQKITVRDELFKKYPDLGALIQDEVNVKEIQVDTKQTEPVVLDTTLTEELKQEGILREVIRAIQDQRKEANLKPSDKIKVRYSSTEEGKIFMEKFVDQIKEKTNAILIEFVPVGNGKSFMGYPILADKLGLSVGIE